MPTGEPGGQDAAPKSTTRDKQLPEGSTQAPRTTLGQKLRQGFQDSALGQTLAQLTGKGQHTEALAQLAQQPGERTGSAQEKENIVDPTSPTGETLTNDRLADLRRMREEMVAGKIHIVLDGREMDLTEGEKLGGGGSKTVYEVIIGEKRYALGLPNTVDAIGTTTFRKWSSVTHEPENTARMRELGFLVSPLCEMVPITVNGVAFNAIRMTPYDELPYEIREGKAGGEFTQNLLPEHLDRKTFKTLLQGPMGDIVRLVRNRIDVGSDSFNICVVDGQLRLFFADLGPAHIPSTSSISQREFAEHFVSNLIGAIEGCMSWEEHRQHQDFFDSEGIRYGSPQNIRDELIADVMRQANAT